MTGLLGVASTGGYQSVDEFLTFVEDAENGVKEEGLFEGRGTSAILCSSSSVVWRST